MITAAVGGQRNRAVSVGAVYMDFRFFQFVQGHFVGMAVIIALAAGNESIFRRNRFQESRRRTGTAAMVAHLQHIALQGASLVKNGLFFLFSASPVNIMENFP